MIKKKWQRIAPCSQLKKKKLVGGKTAENGGEMRKEVDRKTD